MNRSDIEKCISEMYIHTEGNRVEPDCPDRVCAGITLFDEPIFGIGDAGDTLFCEYKKEGAVGPWYMTPNEWLPNARSVISLFFPISEEIRKSNRTEREIGSKQWAYARVEGQQFIARFMDCLAVWFKKQGAQCCVPSSDKRFRIVVSGKGMDGYDDLGKDIYGSNWSERHAAYICGLGTFGLSKGLITKKGMAGRFASIITDCYIDCDQRKYEGIYDYCIKCGVCIKRCPVGAIDLVNGKDHGKCDVNVIKSRGMHSPRYGCGLCQTNVPCECGIPNRV